MPLVTLTNVHCAFGSHVVLDGVTVAIEPGEKIGLAGRNGSGKTTLKRVLVGELVPDSGSRQLRRGAAAGYLRQDPDFDPDETVFDAAEGAFAELHRLHRELRDVFEQMATATGADLERLLKRQARLETRMETAGGYSVNHRIEAALHGLGFADEQLGLRTAVLSGGQKSRLGLARLLLGEPDLLLLDEPTNHLDLDGRRWLERFLAEEYRKAVIVVSHDRWLLDRVAQRIVEVERGTLRSYPGNYSKYVEIRRQQTLTATRTYEKQLDKIRREEEFIRRYKVGQRAKQARGRESRLERFRDQELIERPREAAVMKLTLPKAPRSGEQVVVAEGIAKRYGPCVLFEDFDLTVWRGDRIGVIGPNGEGKTTLVRCLLGEIEPDQGTVRRGSRLCPGHYRQLQDDLDLTLSVWQYLQSAMAPVGGGDRATEQQARDLAGAFLFTDIEQDKPLSALSGGERSRAVLAGLVAGGHNLLVLDEPSNHLDIPSAERLEAALRRDGAWDGTLVVVTHDRALLEATCDVLVVFEGAGRVSVFPGRYSHWEERRAAAAPARPPPEPSAPARPPPPKPATPLSYSALEERIEAIQARIGAIDARLGDPAVYGDGKRVGELTAQRRRHQQELAPLEAEWARRAEGSEPT